MPVQKATYEDLESGALVRLDTFRFMQIEELKNIKPCWITENTKDKAQFIDFNLYKIINISPDKLLQHTFSIGLPTEEIFNDDASDMRYVTTLERWQKNEPVDPPTVCVKDAVKRTLSISDGRHRTVLANYLSQDEIPIAVYKSELETIKMILTPSTT